MFDKYFGTHFAYMLKKGVDLKGYMDKYEAVFGLFCKPDDFAVLKKSIERSEDPPTPVLERVLFSFESARSIFQTQSVGLDYRLYLATVARALKDLEHMSFDTTELESYSKCMRSEIGALLTRSKVANDELEMTLKLWTKEVSHIASEANDTWYSPMILRAKVIASVNDQIPRLPWEDIIFSDVGVEDVPSTFVVPSSILADNICARRQALKFLGADMTTFSQMRKRIMNNTKVLYELDPEFDKEVLYLNLHVEDEAKTWARQGILDALPSEGHETSIDEVLISIECLYHYVCSHDLHIC